ncbi:ABC transporter family substrate-binding protein [Corynebacterium lowii]|uniref:Putative monoacyl phosphatidylinositol tetramannoside-binding protein LpqW n=1 Tax=Corynebacterium lowii TaxID=1544413 RepID=A0A0Q0Z815_9CORY|nr:ABC transporter family substrate-binding protein [Corynebacterium lowii]KQB85728.1 putative monoacyl phosphatidylinositol tetramannoside-binding protein LpqW precursor [Corynebacterium lowii]MDP9851030.1 peptide/nickel transport system substrate-binding protein [Corynebacterium lowii]
MRKIPLIATLLAACLALASCGVPQDIELVVSPEGAYNPQDPEDLRQGGTLTLPISEIPEQQNASHANTTVPTSTLWSWYMPQPALSDSEGTYAPNPNYLTDVTSEVIDGKTVVTYTINPEATYNDGTPMDWRTYENTWRINNGKDEAYQIAASDGYNQIESVTAGENDKQAVVTYSHIYPWWNGLFGILLHPNIVTPEDFNEGFLKKMRPEWGAGPYTVGEIDYQGGTVSFVPNDKWWGSKPRLDKVLYRQMESQAAINAFRAGEIDSVSVSNKNNLATVLGMGDNAELRTAMDTTVSLLTLNSEAPLLSDIKVREAIFTGIDRSLLATIFFNGLGYSEDLPGSLTFFQNQPDYADAMGELIAFDPDRSRALLDEAGWAEGSDGIRIKDGERFTLHFPNFGDSPTSKATAIALQKMLRDIGIELKIQSRPASDFAKVVADKDFDLFNSLIRSNDPNGTTYFGQQYYSDSTLNLSGTGTPEIDEKIKVLEQLPTAEEQNAMARDIEKEALARFGVMPYVNGPATVAVKPGLANMGAAIFATIPKENIGWEK